MEDSETPSTDEILRFLYYSTNNLRIPQELQWVGCSNINFAKSCDDLVKVGLVRKGKPEETYLYYPLAPDEIVRNRNAD